MVGEPLFFCFWTPPIKGRLDGALYDHAKVDTRRQNPYINFLIFRKFMLKSVVDLFEEKSYSFLCFKGIFQMKTCLYK